MKSLIDLPATTTLMEKYAFLMRRNSQLEEENDVLKDKLMCINVECLDKTATRESILVVLLADTQEGK